MKASAKDIQERLHNGIVEFTFKKKNGQIREAKGTLVKSILVENCVSGNADNSSSPNVQVYFDLDKKAFRSFVIGSEMEIISFHEC